MTIIELCHEREVGWRLRPRGWQSEKLIWTRNSQTHEAWKKSKLVTVISRERKWCHHISVINIGRPQESGGCESWWERWSRLADGLAVPARVIACALSWRLQGLSSSVNVSHFVLHATYTLTERVWVHVEQVLPRSFEPVETLTLPGQTSCYYLAGGFRISSTVNSMSQNLNAAHWPRGIAQPKLAQAESHETDHFLNWPVCECFHFMNLVIKFETLCLAHHISSIESGITGKPDAFPF